MNIKIKNKNLIKSWIYFWLTIFLILLMFAITMICAIEKIEKNQQEWNKETKGIVETRISDGD